MEKGFTYKRKDTENGQLFVVESIDNVNNFILFENGAKIKPETIQKDFELVTRQMSESLNGPSLGPDPNTFFDTPLSADALPAKPEGNPIVENSITSRLTDLNAQNNNIPTQTQSSPIISPNQSNNSNLPELNIPEIRLPEFDIFDRIKKDQDIVINVELKIKLPSAQKISAMDDMFESSLIDYLAKQYISKANSNEIRKQMVKAIKDWVDVELGIKKPIVKLAKKKKSEVKPVEAKEETVVVQEPIKTEPTNTVVDNDFLRPVLNVWDKNITKLLMIETEEQFLAVKAKHTELTEKKLINNLFYKCEELLDTYEQGKS